MRAVLIGCGCVVAGVVLCVVACLGVGFVALSSDEGAIGTYYGVIATGTNPGDFGNIACPDSQAIGYADDLYNRFGSDGSMSVTLNTFTEQSDGTYLVTGDIDGTAYSANVTLGDESIFGLFGSCIESVVEN